ncbi:site-2 protease family protein [Rothia nasimurium]|uniref:site-2 protease family protein n=1 Tax=Rothia nasimurium TaxID=85336 RepID=UPI003BA25F70
MVLGSGIRIGRFVGAPIVVKPSWFPLMAVVIIGYGLNLASWRSLTTAQGFLAAAITAVTLAVGVLLHELAHAAVAHARGVRVHAINVNMWGGHTKMHTSSASSSFWVAVSGPIVNFVVAALCYMVWWNTGSADFFGFILAAQVNCAVGIFNLVPAFPLDGGHALEALVFMLTGRRSVAIRVTAYSGLLLIALLVGFLLVTGTWQSMFALIAAAFLGYYLWTGASHSLRRLGEDRNPNHPLRASQLMVPVQFAPADDLIGQASQTWDGASPLVLLRNLGAGGLEPSAVVLPFALEAAVGTLDSQPLAALGQPLATRTMDVQAGLLDTVDEFNGFAYHRLPEEQRDDVVAWIVEDSGRPVGLVTAQALRSQMINLAGEKAL